jgi:glycosyltransferase involved in cell wall biosynthesis
MVKVSICIPTFNSASYVKECVDSALAQDFDDFEVIVSDNRSADNTLDVLHSYRDKRLKIYRQTENRGITQNFNFLINKASGCYVKLLCSDDVLDSAALRHQSEFLDKNNDAILVTCGRREIDAHGDEIRILQTFGKPSVLKAADVQILFLLYGNFIGEPSAVLIRRQAVIDVGGFIDGTATLIDLDMWLKLADRGMLGYLPTTLCSVRRHFDSMTEFYRKAELVEETVSSVAGHLIRSVKANSIIKKVFWGKVAGSHVRRGLQHLSSGRYMDALYRFSRAFQHDPMFIGLLSYLMLFRPGLLSMRTGANGKVDLCIGMPR